MTAIPVSYGAADLVKVTVTFAYDRYVIKPTTKPAGLTDPGPIQSRNTSKTSTKTKKH
jgi:hypothetical protein